MSPSPPQRKGGRGCTRLLGSIAVVFFGVRMAYRCPPSPAPPNTSVRLDSEGWEQTLQQNLAEHGYAHVQQLLNESDAQSLRRLAQDYCYGEKRRALPLSWGGYTVPAFLDLPEFAGARWLLDDARLHKVLGVMFKGAEYRFASHNDIGCDFVGVWHKDILRGPQRKYQVHDLWTPDEAGEQHEIYKVLLYLQDHEQDARAVKVVPGSHVLRDISLERGYAALHPRFGDAVIIDQRISHAGNTFYYPFGPGRIFMQVGFGKANNFTDEFERGTVERQRGYQAKMLKLPPSTGFKSVLADVKFFGLGMLLSALPPQVLNAFADIDVKKYAVLGRLIFGSNAAGKK